MTLDSGRIVEEAVEFFLGKKKSPLLIGSMRIQTHNVSKL